MSTTKAIIDVATLQSYHQWCDPLKLALTTLPTEATINTAAWRRYHHCRRRIRLSLKSLPAKAIIVVIAVWSNHWYRRHWSQYFPSLSALAATSLGLESNKMRSLICRTWDNIFKSNVPFCPIALLRLILTSCNTSSLFSEKGPLWQSPWHSHHGISQDDPQQTWYTATLEHTQFEPLPVCNGTLQ